MGIQFNSKDAKAFRTTLEKFYNAKHAIADLANEKSDNVRAFQTIIDNDISTLDTIEKGEYTGKRTVDEIKADIATMHLKKLSAQSDYEAAVAKKDKDIEAAQTLFTDAMYEGAKKVVSSFGTDLADWRKALADMFKAQGLTDATPTNVSRFDFLVTARVNSSKRIYKDNTLVGVANKKQSANLFLCALAEYLVTEKIITPFKHKYVPVSERNKKSK